jgi:hypothetical protein
MNKPAIKDIIDWLFKIIINSNELDKKEYLNYIISRIDKEVKTK